MTPLIRPKSHHQFLEWRHGPTEHALDGVASHHRAGFRVVVSGADAALWDARPRGLAPLRK